MKPTASIARRITVSVLLLEFLAAIALIAMVTNHERVVRFEALDANLRAMSNALLGAVQEADTEDGSVRLDASGIHVPARAIYRVSADAGQVLGSQGEVPSLPAVSETVAKVRLGGKRYRFYILVGDRVIDPASPRAVNHHVTVIYGVPEGRTWHAVWEATRFVAVATVLLLGITAVALSWMSRRFLLPIRELADEAGQIDAKRWTFTPPASSRRMEELAPLATAIETTVARLQTSFEQQRRFTSDAAHELKTDLAIIKSSVQLLAMKRRSVEEYEQGILLSLGDVARLENTVQRMLTLARLEHGPAIDAGTCDVVAALHLTLAHLRPMAETKRVAIISSAMPATAAVSVSAEDAGLLCSNVLMNALQHSPTETTVTVSVTPSASGSVVVRVRDHGLGILEADRPFLFEPFYRGDASRSRSSGGTGLGLSICKAICDRTGGSIRMENHPEGGAEVTISLPSDRTNRT